jgi:predicted aldo/keto reductase-like oxidoreductase
MEKCGILDFFDSTKADGKIVNAGFSFHGSIEEFKLIVDAYPGNSARTSVFSWIERIRLALKG